MICWACCLWTRPPLLPTLPHMRGWVWALQGTSASTISNTTHPHLPHLHTSRRELHSLLDLPMDRPSLRLGCALTWPQQQGGAAGGPGAAAAGGGGGGSQQERLQDVHAGLPPPGHWGGEGGKGGQGSVRGGREARGRGALGGAASSPPQGHRPAAYGFVFRTPLATMCGLDRLWPD